MMGAKTLKAQIKDGTDRFIGDIGIPAKLPAKMVEFDPRFQVMPGTKALTAKLAMVESSQATVGAPAPE
jgi:hypothetical protein